jgi:hypothetical protein
MPHDMHHFYPEFDAYPTHLDCSDAFVKSLLKEGEKGSND